MSEYYRHVRRLLEKAKDEKTLIAIHERPEDMESFVVGYVVAVSDTQVNVHDVTPKGHLEGVMVIRMENIQRLHWDSDYLRRLQYLLEHPVALQPAPELQQGSAESFEDMLQAAMEAGVVVKLCCSDGKHAGLVTEVGEGWVQIEGILDTGHSDGQYLYPISSIERMDIAGWDEQIDLAVHRARYGIG